MRNQLRILTTLYLLIAGVGLLSLLYAEESLALPPSDNPVATAVPLGTPAPKTGNDEFTLYLPLVFKPQPPLHLPLVFNAPPAATPTITPTPTQTPTATPIPNPIKNGDFEQGHVEWDEWDSYGFPLIVTNSALPSPVTAHSGIWAAWLGGSEGESNTLSQLVAIPVGGSTLRFWYWLQSDDVCGYYDRGAILVAGNTLKEFDLCFPNNTNGWMKYELDLSAYAGRTEWLQFHVQTDASANSNVFIDDVAMGTLPPGMPRGQPATPSPTATPTPTATATPTVTPSPSQRR